MRVSIGIPFFNAERTLTDAVRSVFAQSFPDWELILADDGSTDRSLALASSIRDPRVRVLSDGTNRGLVFRLNQLINLAGGEFFARMDADDIMHPERLARQVDYLLARSHVDIVGTAVWTIDAHGMPRGKRGFDSPGKTPAAVLKGAVLIHPTVMGRMKWFRENRYDPEFYRAEDHELWCRTCTYTATGHLAEPLLFYRESIPIQQAAYAASCRTERRIIRLYGPRTVGRIETCRLLLTYSLKPWALRVAGRIGMQSHVVNRRNAGLTAPERETAERVVRVVRSTPLPQDT
jgi:glycosyltransferase involved in cell wall biosynthesis